MRPVAGSSTVLALAVTHELIARTALWQRGTELPTFAGIYRERTHEAEGRQRPPFQAAMQG